MDTTPIMMWMDLTCKYSCSCHGVWMSCHVILFDCTLHVTRCIEHNIHVLNLPSHTTHLLQVADISIFGPFKSYLRQAEAVRQHNRAGVVQPQQVAALTRKAWEKSTQPANIIAGFKKAGIVPFDRTKIPEKIFKQGALHRHPDSVMSHLVPPPVPTLPSHDSDPLLLLSLSSSSSPPVVETVETILALPSPIPPPPRSKRKYSGINTRFAVMLTEQEVMNKLQQQQEEKEKKEQAAAEKKQRNMQKQQSTTSKSTPTPKKKKHKGIRLTDRLSNKENIPPTSTPDIMDPYDINTN